MNLNSYMDLSTEPKDRVVMQCYLRLDKETILQMLGSDSFFLCGKAYKVPENQLIELLMSKAYLLDSIKFELERIGL